MKKYKFTGETKQVGDITLKRIQAVADFGIIKSGDIGGWIEKEENLSQHGNARVCGNAEVYGNRHLLIIGPIGSRHDFTTFFRDKDGDITVRCGCFCGKIDEFLERVTQTHKDSRHALVYRTAVEIAKLHIDLSNKAGKA